MNHFHTTGPNDTSLVDSLPFEGSLPAATWRQGTHTVTLLRPTITAANLEDHLALAHAYSKLKVGDYREVLRAAHDLVHALTPSICHAIAAHPKEWCILSSGTFRGFGLPSAAVLFAQECASRIALPHYMIPLAGSDRSKVSSTRYEELPTREERISILGQEFAGANIPGLAGKRVLLCDDSLTSGTFMDLATACAHTLGAKEVLPYVIHRFDGMGDHSFEHVVNISGFKDNTAQFFRELLSDEKTSFTSRLVSFGFNLPADTLRAVLRSVPSYVCTNLLAAGVVFYGSKLPREVPSILTELEPKLKDITSLTGDTLEERRFNVGTLLMSRRWRNTPLPAEALVSVFDRDVIDREE